MRIPRRISFVLDVLGLLCAVPALAQSSATPEASACPSAFPDGAQSCTAAIAAHQKLDLQVNVPGGTVRDFSAEQVAGFVAVHVDNQDAPFANPAGLHAKIHILLGSGDAAARKLTLENSSSRPATVLMQLGAARPADAKAAQEQEAEKALALAEMLRGQKTSARAEALADYDKAIALWRALGDTGDATRASSWKAIFLFLHENDAAAALPVIAGAEDGAGSLDAAEAANYWKSRGFIEAQLSHYEAAREDYSKALAGFGKTGDEFNQALLLDNLSRVERMEGNKTAALADASEAAALAQKLGDKRRQLGIEEEIGAIDITAGDLEPAYDAYESALALLQASPDARMEGYVWSDMGVLYTMLNDPARAQDALDHASSVWAHNPNPFGEMNTLDDYGDLLMEQNKPDAAMQYYRRGLAVAEKSGAARYRIFFLRGIGDSYAAEKDDAHAEESLRQALDLANQAREGDSTAHIYCSLADIALRRRDVAAAREHYSHCEEKAAEDPIMKIRAEGGLARVDYQAGNLESAEAHCESALGGIETLRGSLNLLDLRTSYFASMHAYYDFDIEILSRLDKAQPGAGYPWKAFLAAERGRARTLLEEVAASDDRRMDIAAPVLRAQYDDVRRRLRALENRQSTVQRGRNAKEDIAELTLEEHSLHEELAAEEKNGKAGASTEPLTLRGIEEALPDLHSELVEYWTGEDESYAWAIDAAGIRMFRLPSEATLDGKVTRLRNAILAEVSWPPTVSAEQRAKLLPIARQHSQTAAGELARAVFPAGLMRTPAATLLIVGDGPLLSVPFAALPLTSATRIPVTFLSEPSAAIYTFLEAHPIAARSTQIAVFVDDRSRGGSRSAGVQQVAAGNAALPTLQFAGDEAAMIQSVFNPSATRVFTGPAVAPEAIRDLDWSTFSIGHFAMHAVLNAHYAELNGLVTGSSTTAPMLWYGDVCRLHARLDLVVLSACNTALGENVPGEGLMGISQAFFAAGSQRVLGTLWQVDDQATSEWMRHFYVALKTTRSPAKALRRAQREMAATPQWNSPYYWAGFTLAGDWRPLP